MKRQRADGAKISVPIGAGRKFVHVSGTED